MEKIVERKKRKGKTRPETIPGSEDPESYLDELLN
jgi:hypothetical protein